MKETIPLTIQTWTTGSTGWHTVAGGLHLTFFLCLDLAALLTLRHVNNLPFRIIPRAKITRSTFNFLNLVSGWLKKLKAENSICLQKLFSAISFFFRKKFLSANFPTFFCFRAKLYPKKPKKIHSHITAFFNIRWLITCTCIWKQKFSFFVWTGQKRPIFFFVFSFRMDWPW